MRKQTQFLKQVRKKTKTKSVKLLSVAFLEMRLKEGSRKDDNKRRHKTFKQAIESLQK